MLGSRVVVKVTAAKQEGSPSPMGEKGQRRGMINSESREAHGGQLAFEQGLH